MDDQRQLCAPAIAIAGQMFHSAPALFVTTRHDGSEAARVDVKNLSHLLDLISSADLNALEWLFLIDPSIYQTCQVYAVTTVAGTAYCSSCAGWAYKREAGLWTHRSGQGVAW